MSAVNTVINTYQAFANVAAPYLHIRDDAHYEEALALIEDLLERARDDADDPLDGLITLLSRAIGDYEESLESLSGFEAQAHEGPADLAMFRLLMDQHNLGVADFPEIGDKSLISRILRGERNLTKQHIQKLAERFHINPGLFFKADE